MRKLHLMILVVVGVLGLSGCGSNYKCDKKEYAESALNLALFGETKGSGDKSITIQSLGFEIGDDIVIAKLDKANKQSICQVKVNNKFLERALEIERQMKQSKEMDDKLTKEYIETIPEPYSLLFLQQSGSVAATIAMSDFYKVYYKNKSRLSPDEISILHAFVLVANKYAYAKGLVYRVFDNGNGDIMIGL